jgi:COP9 signalosome complex subunit 4
MERRLEQILGMVPAGTNDTTEVNRRVESLLTELIDSEAYNEFATVLTKILAETVPVQVMKSTLMQFVTTIKRLKGEPFETIASLAVSAIKSHVMNFDEADYVLRQALFDHFVGQEQFREAAQMLAGINVENLSNQEKSELYVKCAEAFLEDDETVDAEVFLNKASSSIQTVTEVALLLRYRATYARVLDANRKFVEAAMRYYELSNTTNADVVQEDLLELLGKAVTCAVLGKAGAQRSRVLGLLSKDERIHSLDQLSSKTYSSHAAVLQKMYMEQILRRDELATFEASLAPHQKAMTSEGFTIPEKAVIEHNMLATGKIYDNITFTELGNILRLDAARAEKVAARMIVEERLKASIDQTEGLLLFGGDASALRSWDERIKEVCSGVAELVEAVQQSYPTLVQS